MGRSAGVQSKAAVPGKFKYSWNANTGTLSYYDRETETNTEVPCTKENPFKFLVIEDCVTIGGGKKVSVGNEKKWSSYWSELVPNDKYTKNTVFHLKDKDGDVVSGTWTDGSLRGRKDTKYIRLLFIGVKSDDGLTLSRLELKGAGVLGAWFDLNVYNVFQGAFKIVGKQAFESENGTKYAPVFEHVEKIPEELDAMAKELDMEVQAYFAQGVAEDDGYRDSNGFAPPYDPDAIPDDIADQIEATEFTGAPDTDSELPF